MEDEAAILERVQLLLEILEPGEVADWFATENSFLEGRVPIDMLFANEYKLVLQAAGAFRNNREL